MSVIHRTIPMLLVAMTTVVGCERNGEPVPEEAEAVAEIEIATAPVETAAAEPPLEDQLLTLGSEGSPTRRSKLSRTG